MIYKEHGLTTEIAFNSALKKADIEITSYIAPQEITTDVICAIDTTRHDEKIRADERKKTIDEFLERVLCDDCEGKCSPNVMYCYKCVAMRVAEKMKGEEK